MRQACRGVHQGLGCEGAQHDVAISQVDTDASSELWENGFSFAQLSDLLGNTDRVSSVVALTISAWMAGHDQFKSTKLDECFAEFGS